MQYRNLIGMRGIVVVTGTLLVALLHHLTPLRLLHWHNAFQHLYYLPIVFAGLSFGWAGGLAAALFTALANAPHNFASWQLAPDYATDQVSEIPLFCAAGILTGVLAQRGRKQRSDLERTTQRLTEVYRELQDNFERMKRAERLFALGQLSAGLAHEVRNPLASIAGAAGILQRNPRLNNRDAECLAIITKECQRLNHLVTDFLAFARPRPPDYQPIAVAKVIDSVLDLAAHAGLGKATALRAEFAPDIGSIEGDSELLQQVLLNLVMNAIQASPDGGEVLVSAKRRDGRVLIEVQDQGCGIDPTHRDRIFDPFFTTKENGTGLGLSVAHQIVEQHGGILTAHANPDSGMTFAVLLPALHEKQHET